MHLPLEIAATDMRREKAGHTQPGRNGIAADYAVFGGFFDRTAPWGQVRQENAVAEPNCAAQPLGSCKMRSPIMFFCTGEVPPAMVMLSL